MGSVSSARRRRNAEGWGEATPSDSAPSPPADSAPSPRADSPPSPRAGSSRPSPDESPRRGLRRSSAGSRTATPRDSPGVSGPSRPPYPAIARDTRSRHRGREPSLPMRRRCQGLLPFRASSASTRAKPVVGNESSRNHPTGTSRNVPISFRSPRDTRSLVPPYFSHAFLHRGGVRVERRHRPLQLPHPRLHRLQLGEVRRDALVFPSERIQKHTQPRRRVAERRVLLRRRRVQSPQQTNLGRCHPHFSVHRRRRLAVRLLRRRAKRIRVGGWRRRRRRRRRGNRR